MLKREANGTPQNLWKEFAFTPGNQLLYHWRRLHSGSMARTVIIHTATFQLTHHQFHVDCLARKLQLPRPQVHVSLPRHARSRGVPRSSQRCLGTRCLMPRLSLPVEIRWRITVIDPVAMTWLFALSAKPGRVALQALLAIGT